MAEPTSVIAAWLLTYLVHSTVLLLTAWLATWLFRPHDRTAELLWRSALFGSIITATAQIRVGGPVIEFAPLSMEVAAAGSANPVAEPATSTAAPETATPVDAVPDAMTIDVTMEHPVGAPVMQARESDYSPIQSAGESTVNERHSGLLNQREPAEPQEEAASSRTRAGALLIGLGLAFGLWALMRMIIARSRLRARLSGRTDVSDESILALFHDLQARARLRRSVRLTVTSRLAVPVAFGVLRREICLPAPALSHLSRIELRSLLAHELAHHVYRDPLWLLAEYFVRHVLFFQPLNHVAVRRLRELSEFRCDAWAARIMNGDRGALARCLSRVAAWLSDDDQLVLHSGAAGMATEPTLLRRRVARLVSGTNASPSRWRLAVHPLVAVVLTSVSLAAPGARVQHLRDHTADETAAAVIDPVSASAVNTSIDELAVLDMELASLQDDLQRLTNLVRELSPAEQQSLQPLITQITQQLTELRQRRKHLPASDPDAAGMRLR